MGVIVVVVDCTWMTTAAFTDAFSRCTCASIRVCSRRRRIHPEIVLTFSLVSSIEVNMYQLSITIGFKDNDDSLHLFLDFLAVQTI